ncbi:MAG: type II toxin-antitoxin system YafQ family toxin [Acidobacteria bacterium]|nr:type II toxin-antitoxin system YafQ family toxin [Acidobacteriota bacterium]
MRAIERTSQFKRDYKRESRGRHRASLDEGLTPVVEALAKDQPLHPRRRDHALSGPWSDYRDCHIKPDLVLIYSKPDAGTLRLVRLGSHSELGF